MHARETMIMRRGRDGSSVARGYGAQIPLQTTPSPSPLRVDDHINVPTCEVMFMMQSFQRMLDALNNRLNQEATGTSIHREGPINSPNVSDYRKLDKFKVPMFHSLK
jgi:hypothetical protein